MVKEIVKSHQREVENFEKKEFEEKKELEDAMFLLQERTNALRVRLLISIEQAQQYYARLREKYNKENAKLQEKSSTSNISMSSWKQQIDTPASAGYINRQDREERERQEQQEREEQTRDERTKNNW